jgi:hypothetical protein
MLPSNSLDRDCVAEKLTPDNYLVWKVVIMPVVHGARLVGYLYGTIPAPPEELAIEKDVSGKMVTTMEETLPLWHGTKKISRFYPIFLAQSGERF